MIGLAARARRRHLGQVENVPFAPVLPTEMPPTGPFASMTTGTKMALALLGVGVVAYAVSRRKPARPAAAPKQTPAPSPSVQVTVQSPPASSKSSERRRAWSRLPAGWTKASLEDFWDSVGGRVRTCIKQIEGRVDNPGAFCSSIADRLEPGWRSKPRRRRRRSR